MRFEVAQEKVTDFPCVRLEEQQEFISLFPVTKIQAEEWIWRTGPVGYDAAEFSAFLDRLAVRNTEDQFPKAVASLARQPIPQQSPDTLMSLIATNLSVWKHGEEEIAGIHFPTPKSEWGQLTGWLGGRIPDYHEWGNAVLLTNLIPTKEIVKGVLSSSIQWPLVLKDLLGKVEETISPDATGLPFMKEGLYELVADCEKPRRFAINQREESRPFVAGESPIWPTLSNATANTETLTTYRPLRRHTLPVVAVRLWFATTEVNPESQDYQSFEVKEIEPQESKIIPNAESRSIPTASASSAPSRWSSWFRRKRVEPGPQVKQISPYISVEGRMKYKCPFCHQAVEPEVFMTKAHFCCYEQKIALKEGERDKIGRGGFIHTIEIPQETVNQVTRQYLEVAQEEPDAVHTVFVGGFREAGKTTWLLSVGGQMDYPDGKPIILSAFPENWRFWHMPCSLSSYIHKETVTDRKTWTERMWLDGRLPPRNSGQEKAFECPILFNCSPRQTNRRFLALLKDIAGELLFQGIANNKNFPHVASTADAIFFLPSDDISTVYLEAFIKEMGLANEGGISIDLKKINLIIVISKIDQLKYGGQAERELLERILPRSYEFPQYRGEQSMFERERWNVEELKEYIAEMEGVHLGIESWIHKHKPMIETYTKEFFGSVRYCGLSAFGFQPIKARNKNKESSLPFAPLPVRAVDPILWLLKENHLIEF